jgi:pilus assembly protein Flp/PilA
LHASTFVGFRSERKGGENNMTKFLFAVHSRWTELKNNERGATAVEYGIMVALIAVVIIAAVWAIGQNLNGTFGEVNTCLEGPDGCTGGAL